MLSPKCGLYKLCLLTDEISLKVIHLLNLHLLSEKHYASCCEVFVQMTKISVSNNLGIRRKAGVYSVIQAQCKCSKNRIKCFEAQRMRASVDLSFWNFNMTRRDCTVIVMHLPSFIHSVLQQFIQRFLHYL
jgi:hypothetical protein